METESLEPRRFYAFVEGVEQPRDSANRRMHVILDLIDAEMLDHEKGARKDSSALGMGRILSTPHRLRTLFDLPEDPSEGKWLELEVGRRPGHPMFWMQSLADNPARNPERLNVRDMRYFAGPEGGFVGGLGEGRGMMGQASPMLLAFVQELETEPSITKSDLDNIKFRLLTLVSTWGDDLHPRVIDVGQAQCVAIHRTRLESSPVVAFVDVGAPLFFHGHTLPRRSHLQHLTIDPDAIVLLSHWDWDHWSAARRLLPCLCGLNWYAPFQTKGAVTDAFRNSLGARLKYIDGDLDLGNVKLARGLGAVGNCNETGYVMRIESRAGIGLLTADVSYGNLPPGMETGVDGMTACHHMGRGSESPPAATPGARVIASFGEGNKYGHAYPDALAEHLRQGWVCGATAGDLPLSGSSHRGSRWLLPPAVSARAPLPIAAE